MGSYTAAVVTDGVLLSTAMSSRQLLLVTALCASLVHSKILRSSIVRGQGFAAPPPGHTLNISPLQQQEAPRQQQAVSHFSQPRKPVKIISEFDRPGSFQPMKANYNKQKFEPTTEKSFVSGPPLGDDFFDRYTELIKRHQKKQKKRQLSFAGLLPADLVDRRKRKHQDPQVPAFYQIKAPVTLDYASKPLEDFGFNPNGKWYGEQATGLLQLIFPKKQLVRGKADWLLLLSQSLGSKKGLCLGEDSSQEGVHQGELLPQRVARVQEQGGGDGDQEQCLQCQCASRYQDQGCPKCFTEILLVKNLVLKVFSSESEKFIQSLLASSKIIVAC